MKNSNPAEHYSTNLGMENVLTVLWWSLSATGSAAKAAAQQGAICVFGWLLYNEVRDWSTQDWPNWYTQEATLSVAWASSRTNQTDFEKKEADHNPLSVQNQNICLMLQSFNVSYP